MGTPWKVPNPVTYVESQYQLDNLLDDIMDRESTVLLVPKQWRKSGKAIAFGITRLMQTRSFTLSS